jgi:rhodanese-related sulfurtransferase
VAGRAPWPAYGSGSSTRPSVGRPSATTDHGSGRSAARAATQGRAGRRGRHGAGHSRAARYVEGMASPVFDQPGLEVDVPQLKAALADGAVTLVDVREDYEWAEGRIDGAVHVPMGELGARLGELPQDETIVINCRVGGRSGMAAQALRDAGYDAWSLRGGLLAWDRAGEALVPEGGRVADH